MDRLPAARFFRILGVTLLIALAALVLWQNVLEALENRSHVRGRMVDAGGHRVRMIVSGTGHDGPTVILEWGVGGAAARRRVGAGSSAPSSASRPSCLTTAPASGRAIPAPCHATGSGSLRSYTRRSITPRSGRPPWSSGYSTGGFSLYTSPD